MKKLITILGVFMIFPFINFSQGTGEIKGVIMDYEKNETIIGASVWVRYAGNKIGESTDINGKYTIKPLEAGSYNLEVSFIGKETRRILGVTVKSDKIRFMDTIFLKDSSIMIGGEEGGVVIEGFRGDELIEPGEAGKVTLDETRISEIAGAGRGNNTLLELASDGAVKTSADGSEIFFKGSRSGAFVTFLDGVKLRGNAPMVPASALKNYTVYTGGLPAKYGDTMGGVVVIETKNFFDLYNQRVAQMGITYDTDEPEEEETTD